MKKVNWQEITQFKEPEHSPGFLLWQISIKWRRLIETALQPLKLTHPQFVLLASLGWLLRTKDNISQVELARHCKTDITMTSQVLRTLENKGLITREQRQDDERSKFSRLTSKGVQLIEQALPLVEAVDKNFFETLEPDVGSCVGILKKLV